MGVVDARAAKAALWTMLGIFVVFKLATTAMIAVADPRGAGAAWSLFLVLHWPFILVGVVAGLLFAALWALFRARLLRVRARRRELEAAEWSVD